MAIIYEDTRQQAGKHKTKHAWFEKHGIELVRKKLDFGDYIADGSNIAIDTKQNIAEVAGNVGRDHDRLIREIERANDSGYRLLFLIEERGYHEIPDVARWVPTVCRRCDARIHGYCDPQQGMRCVAYKRKPMQGTQIAKTMRSIAANHHCYFEFCDKMSTARIICERLGVNYE